MSKTAVAEARRQSSTARQRPGVVLTPVRADGEGARTNDGLTGSATYVTAANHQVQRRSLHRHAPRPARFALTGVVCGAVQLALFALLRQGMPALAANILAFLLSAQVNFALAVVFTWRERTAGVRRPGALPGRWAAYHASIMATAVLNQAVFALAAHVLPETLAVALGIGVAALANYLLQDGVVFRAVSADARPRAEATRADTRATDPVHPITILPVRRAQPWPGELRRNPAPVRREAPGREQRQQPRPAAIRVEAER